MNFNLTNALIERCDKESEEVISKEDISFLSTSLNHFKQNRNEFLYIESPEFEPVNIDAVSLELDDVFETYMILLGLKVQKKYLNTIKTFLDENLFGEELKNYSAAFSNEDGLWELNIPINYMDGFKEEMSIEEALNLSVNFIHSLMQIIKQQQ
ncbi:branched-chain amino acid aminotransferase [Ureibacillus composti]|nr:branched-chain amino acid aminotransferase [Ureibacillus composti]